MGTSYCAASDAGLGLSAYHFLGCGLVDILLVADDDGVLRLLLLNLLRLLNDHARLVDFVYLHEALIVL